MSVVVMRDAEAKGELSKESMSFSALEKQIQCLSFPLPAIIPVRT